MMDTSRPCPGHSAGALRSARPAAVAQKHCRPGRPPIPAAALTTDSGPATGPSTSGRDLPPSWPTEAARRAAFGNAEPERVQCVAAEVSGRLPAWLQGVYLRNGPGTYDNGAPGGMKHMFDGYGLLVKFELDGGRNAVTASHSFVGSDAYRRFKATGQMPWREFGTAPPRDSLLAKAADVAGMILGSLGLGAGVTDNASVNVVPHGDQVWAMTETVVGTFAVDPGTLETQGRVEYSDSLKGDLTTAHPTILPNGDFINFTSAPGLGFSIYRQRAPPVGPASRAAPVVRELLATVPHHRALAPAWIHDFPASHKHMVIPETPMYFNLAGLVFDRPTDYLFMDWKPQNRTRLHVVSLETGAVKTFTAPPFFAFHWANAYESPDGRYLHLEGAIYDDPEIVNHLSLKNVRAGPEVATPLPRCGLRRLTLDLQAPNGSEVPGGWEHVVEDESSYGNFVEFPRVAASKAGQKHRFAWGTCAVRPTNVNNALLKVDAQEKGCLVWHEAGVVVGEPTFVPAPGSTNEDEGVVLSVLVQADGNAALLVLDAQSHAEVARARLPYGLPNGFHGGFMPAASAS